MVYMTEREAAEYLKVAEKQIRLARYRKKIPSINLFGVVQYRQSDLDAYRESLWEEDLKATNSKNTDGRPTGTSQVKEGSARGKRIGKKLRSILPDLSLTVNNGKLATSQSGRL